MDIEEETESTQEDSSQEEQPQGRTFTQKELSDIAAREKREGKRAAQRELAEVLGVADVDEAAAILKQHRERQDAEKSEAEKARAEAERYKREAETERQAARVARTNALTDRLLLKAGAPSDKLDRVSRMLTLVDEPTEQDISDAIADLKQDFESLFTTSEPDGSPDSDPGSSGRRSSGKPPAVSYRDRLEKRHPNLRDHSKA